MRGHERRLARIEALQPPSARDSGLDWSRLSTEQLRRLRDITRRAKAEGRSVAETIEALNEDEIRDLREMTWAL